MCFRKRYKNTWEAVDLELLLLQFEFFLGYFSLSNGKWKFNILLFTSIDIWHSHSHSHSQSHRKWGSNSRHRHLAACKMFFTVNNRSDRNSIFKIQTLASLAALVVPSRPCSRPFVFCPPPIFWRLKLTHIKTHLVACAWLCVWAWSTLWHNLNFMHFSLTPKKGDHLSGASISWQSNDTTTCSMRLKRQPSQPASQLARPS